MKRIAAIIAALGLFGVVLAGRTSMMNLKTEKPLPVITESANAPDMLAPVKAAPARPAHTEMAGFAAG